MRKLISGFLIIIFLISAVFLGLNAGTVRADGVIYIRADGSVDPPSAPIYTADNITYTLTGDIIGSIYVYRSNIVFDGSGYTLRGPGGSGSAYGIELVSVSGVTVENTNAQAYNFGFYLFDSSNNTLSQNSATGDSQAGIYLDSSSNNILSGNNVDHSSNQGIRLHSSSNNTLSGNNLAQNSWEGIRLDSSSNNNILSDNSESGTTYLGFHLPVLHTTCCCAITRPETYMQASIFLLLRTALCRTTTRLETDNTASISLILRTTRFWATT